MLGGRGERPKGAPASWEWRGRPEDGLYCGLYPRAWTVYNIPEVGVRLICRQVSPCLPHNYTDSSLPATVFIFSVENNSGKELKVGVTLCFKNGTGSKRDQVWQPLLGAGLLDSAGQSSSDVETRDFYFPSQTVCLAWSLCRAGLWSEG